MLADRSGMCDEDDMRHDVVVGTSGRLTAAVCGRAFSTPEAFAYEMAIGEAVARSAAPVLRRFDLGRPLLDVGCGAGRLGSGLASDGLGAVVGIDPSRAEIRMASRRLPVARATAGALPFAAASFTATVSCCSFKHWPNRVEGISECARVVKPGGQILIIEVDGGCTEAEFDDFAKGTRLPGPLRGPYVRFAMRTVVATAPTIDELADALARSGLDDPNVSREPDSPFLVGSARAG